MKQQATNILDTVIPTEKCTGCQACRQICPYNAIDMIEDEEGFLHPVKNSNCVNCGACSKICPVVNEVKRYHVLDESQVYLLRHKDDEVVKHSSSGGAFTAIVQAYYDKNCIIFGAAYEENLKVVHNYIKDIKELRKFRKSKYVQSNVKDTYSEVKKFLLDRKKVIYSGTPCQIAGLKNYLAKDYENLLCIDLICHGVPSQKVFDKYIEFLEKKYGCEIKEISFRERTKKNDKWNSRNIAILFNDGKKIIEDSITNRYLLGYHGRLFFRKSCGTCKFASIKRNSDITIADCWGIEKLFKDVDVHEGQSLVIINTEKGKKFFEKVKINQNVTPLSIEFAILSNAQFSSPTKFHKNRAMFYDNIDKIQFDKLISKCLKSDLIKTKIKKIIPKSFKKLLKKLLRRK